MAFVKPIALRCPVQHYPWGKSGVESLVAGLTAALDLEKNYAELWVGAHEKAPAQALPDRVRLDSLIAKHPKEILGTGVCENFGGSLPYLFKIISVAKPLSIQAHPDAEFARGLNSRAPEHYPDARHKPELAFAISELEMLYGIKSKAEIVKSVEENPEFALIFGEEICQNLLDASEREFSDILERAVAQAFSRSADLIKEVSLSLFSRLSEELSLSQEQQWILSLRKDYPEGDIGIFFFFLMNLEKLKPGEAVFIEPNVLHSYLSGDLAECLANSDNVVRAGLTAKHKDSDALLEMVPWRTKKLAKIEPKSIGSRTGLKRYCVAAEEFYLDFFSLSSKRTTSWSTINGVEILFCLDGSGELHTKGASVTFSSGDAFLLPAEVGEYELLIKRGRLFRIGVPSEEKEN